MTQFRDLTHQEQFAWWPGAAEAAELWNLAQADVEAIARHPQRVELDPRMAHGKSWHTERRRVGDITVVVTYPDDRLIPLIWGVYMHLPTDAPSAGLQFSGKSKIPRTLRGLKVQIIEAGLKIKVGAKHDRVETPDGRYVGTLPTSPAAGTSRSLANTTAAIRRKAAEAGYPFKD